MYNRYIRGENGAYARVSQEPMDRGEPPPAEKQEPTPRPSSPNSSRQPTPPHSDGLTNFLQHILDRFHLDHVDTGDLLLLALLFYLFRQDADEELLIALGLLLIL